MVENDTVVVIDEHTVVVFGSADVSFDIVLIPELEIADEQTRA